MQVLQALLLSRMRELRSMLLRLQNGIRSFPTRKWQWKTTGMLILNSLWIQSIAQHSGHIHPRNNWITRNPHPAELSHPTKILNLHNRIGHYKIHLVKLINLNDGLASCVSPGYVWIKREMKYWIVVNVNKNKNKNKN